jgi:hypothetical protein
MSELKITIDKLTSIEQSLSNISNEIKSLKSNPRYHSVSSDKMSIKQMRQYLSYKNQDYRELNS